MEIEKTSQDKSDEIIIKLLRPGDVIRIVDKKTKSEKIVIIQSTVGKKFNIIGVYSEYSNSLLLTINSKIDKHDINFKLNFTHYTMSFVSFKEYNFIETTIKEQCSKEVLNFFKSSNSRNKSIFKEFGLMYFKEYPKDTANRINLLKSMMINNKFPKNLIVDTDTCKMKKFRTIYVIKTEQELTVDKKRQDLDSIRQSAKDSYKQQIADIKKNMIRDRLGRPII